MDSRERPNPPPDPNPSLVNEDSPKKLPAGAGGGGGDRPIKRDEWSEGAVSSLLEAYEAKWVLRNRAKLKGQDWEDVARHVSARANSTKSPKTQTQCKNKIESMKKRYRSASASENASSSWPLYPRLDLLLRGAPPPTPPPQQAAPLPKPQQAGAPFPAASPVALLDTYAAPVQNIVPPAPPAVTAQNSHGSNGYEAVVKEDGPGPRSEKAAAGAETESSTPALYSEKERSRKRKVGKRRRPRGEDESGAAVVAESIRWLGEVVVRSERARMEAAKEIERMRAEAEAKRAEMDLKRTEIIANTQLEIARIFANAAAACGGGGGGGASKGVDSSLRIGRN